jgi:hypothetical protein
MGGGLNPKWVADLTEIYNNCNNWNSSYETTTQIIFQNIITRI